MGSIGNLIPYGHTVINPQAEVCQEDKRDYLESLPIGLVRNQEPLKQVYIYTNEQKNPP